MSKPLPPKNTPFKDLLSGLREKLISEKKQVKTNEPIYRQSSKGAYQKNPKLPQATNQSTDKDIKRILRSNYSAPPIVIRNSIQTKTIKSDQKNVAESSAQESHLSISKVPNPPIKFSWVKNQKDTQYQFNYSRGMQFQPTQYSEDEIREIAIGFDFGTSSSKLTIRDRQASNSFAVSFGQNQGIDSYLLPSKINQVGDLFSLKTSGKEFANLKIRVISSSPSNEDILATIAYIALVVRHARSQFFTQNDNIYRKHHFLWRLNVGIPARTVQKFEIKNRILDIFRAAFICSYGESDSVSICEAQHSLDLISEKKISSNFYSLPRELQDSFGGSHEGFLEEGVRIYPEIMAQIHGFVHSNAWNPERNPHIMMIDIGAGTLDISLCDVIKNSESIYCYYPLACMVEGLGVSNFVKSRVDQVYKLVDSLPIEMQELALQSLLCVDDINYGKISVPSPLNQMLEGFEFSDKDPDTRFDKAFKSLIGPVLWSQTTFRAAQTFLPGHASWNPFPVFVCGGGSRMDFYKNFIGFYAENHGLRARFDIKELPKPKDLFNLDIDPSDYDRLSVAYGLGYWDLGKFLPDFEAPRMEVVGTETPTWSDNYVSKDMT